ncbi:toll/interleukin-1 receptor domain-containing protein [Candidatus Palauibacter sp.]|uniref:toll/interleukin-1 receptor domain-containing protein n=1 Tax=Candidatus Palauibacter sp. TaxID=3101350 RepID=UPI003C6F33EB
MIAFISYSYLDREYARQTKQVLEEVGIAAFIAHEDLEVSEEWKVRIIEELKSCDLFIPLLSENFRRSKWAPQEAGFVASRPEVRIAPLSIDGTIPFGFIEHVQSTRIGEGGVTRELLVIPLARKQPRVFLPALIKIAVEARGWRSAERRIRPLVPLFPLFTAEEAQTFAERAVNNDQVWSASECRTEHLPEFIRAHGHQIKSATLKALQYQIDNDRPYIPSTQPGRRRRPQPDASEPRLDQ